MTTYRCPACGIRRAWSMSRWIAHRLDNFTTHHGRSAGARRIVRVDDLTPVVTMAFDRVVQR